MNNLLLSNKIRGNVKSSTLLFLFQERAGSYQMHLKNMKR